MLALGRLYLPREGLMAAGIESTDPGVVVAASNLPVVCAQILQQARDHFQKSDPIMNRNPRRIVRAPRIMSEYYRAILERLAERGFVTPRHPVKLSKAAKLLILFRYAFI